MKTIVWVVAVAAVMIAGWLVLTEQRFMVYCCHKGQCRFVTRPACQQMGGRIVDNCGQCK